jgi:protein-S-isoprenylcysteine O-methyltransferase Ste14
MGYTIFDDVKLERWDHVTQLKGFSVESLFKISFAILWVVYLAARLYFQRRIEGTLEYARINKRQEQVLFRMSAIAYLLLPLYFLTAWIDFASIPAPLWLHWSGGVIACAGLVLFCWAHQALGRNWTAVLALSKEHELVQRGPYRCVRHPMYSAFFIIGIGWGLLSSNWLVAGVYLGPLVIMYETRVSAEEKMMIGRFGNTYREYMSHTGRLFPRWQA